MKKEIYNREMVEAKSSNWLKIEKIQNITSNNFKVKVMCDKDLFFTAA